MTELELTAILKAQSERPGLLLVVSGPSGVGKGTVLRRLLANRPNITRCVTCTTRQPRTGEVPDVDYCFRTVDEFRAMIAENDFLEYAEVHGNFYGTPLSHVRAILDSGMDAILEIDVQGGLTVKRKMPEAISVFIAPPAMADLEKRLHGRNTDSEEVIQRRINNARGEIACIPEYDYLIVNDVLDEAVRKLDSVIVAEHLRVRGFLASYDGDSEHRTLNID